MFNFPISNKIYITSDIHGGLKLLKELVERVEENSLLFIIGDMIEKGDDSLGTLEYVFELSKQDNVFVTMGNNDYALVKALEPSNLEFFKSKVDKETSILKQMKNIIQIEDPKALQDEINIRYKDLINFLKNLKTHYIVEDFLLVHAGIGNSLEESSLLDLIGQDGFYNRGHDSNNIIVCGHYPTAMYYNDAYNNNILIDEDKRLICIDGGYKATNVGQLNMLEIKKLNDKYEYIQHSVDDFPKIVIKEDHIGFGNNRGICFPDYELEVIEKQEFFSKVRIVATNENLIIKNEMIECQGNKCYSIDDCPNNHLSITKNEVVSLIWDNYEGYRLVKKDGVCGWVRK